MDTISRIAGERGASSAEIDANESQKAIASGTFHTALVGYFKRGKSTLINALLGSPLLPTDVSPSTSAITIVQYGSYERVRIIFTTNEEREIPASELSNYVSEEGNPNNEKNVHSAIVEFPAPLLSDGMCLVDTPGIGSVFNANSNVTNSYLSHIDVALVVLGNDPPITKDEFELIQSVVTYTSSFIFLLNKSDKVSEAERQKAERFTRHILSDLFGDAPLEILHISAKNHLEGKNDEGIQQLTRRLKQIACQSGKQLADRSARKAVRYLAERLIQHIDLEQEGLLKPLDLLNKSLHHFQEKIRDIDDLILAALTRYRQETCFDWSTFEQAAEDCILHESKNIAQSVGLSCNQYTGKKGGLRQYAFERARVMTEDVLTKYANQAQHYFEAASLQRTQSAQNEMQHLFDRILSAASDSFSIHLPATQVGALPKLHPPVNFTIQQTVMALDASVFLYPLMDRLATRKRVIRMVENWIYTFVQDWLTQNIGSIHTRLIHWLDETIKQLSESIQIKLDTYKEEITQSVKKAIEIREKGETAVSDRIQILKKQRRQLNEAIQNIS